jgi:ABC-type sugar transport system ATPase subunit
LISSELDEVLRTSHSVVVMREKKKVGEFTEESAEKIMHVIAGS